MADSFSAQYFYLFQYILQKVHMNYQYIMEKWATGWRLTEGTGGGKDREEQWGNIGTTVPA